MVEESVFEIVSQLNRGAALITAAEEREQLAGLNLLAGRRAGLNRICPALTYLTTGVALLRDAWERRPEPSRSRPGRMRVPHGRADGAEARLAELASRATSLPDLATVTRLRVDSSWPSAATAPSRSASTICAASASSGRRIRRKRRS